MSKTLDIDQDIKLWQPAFDAVMAGNPPVCPKCKSNDIDVTKDSNKDGVGYLLITCNGCGKSGYFSRVLFNKGRTNNWPTATLMEAPFWRDGMTAEEYDVEREYYAKNMDLVRERKYVPLWKQKVKYDRQGQ